MGQSASTRTTSMLTNPHWGSTLSPPPGGQFSAPNKRWRPVGSSSTLPHPDGPPPPPIRRQHMTRRQLSRDWRPAYATPNGDATQAIQSISAAPRRGGTDAVGRHALIQGTVSNPSGTNSRHPGRKGTPSTGPASREWGDRPANGPARRGGGRTGTYGGSQSWQDWPPAPPRARDPERQRDPERHPDRGAEKRDRGAGGGSGAGKGSRADDKGGKGATRHGYGRY